MRDWCQGDEAFPSNFCLVHVRRPEGCFSGAGDLRRWRWVRRRVPSMGDRLRLGDGCRSDSVHSPTWQRRACRTPLVAQSLHSFGRPSQLVLPSPPTHLRLPTCSRPAVVRVQPAHPRPPLAGSIVARAPTRRQLGSTWSAVPSRPCGTGRDASGGAS